MEIHLHLAAAYPGEPWVEHFEWLEPVFNERLEIRDGRMHVPDRPGLGFTLSEAAASWTREARSEEHTSALQSLMRISYAVFCLQKKNQRTTHKNTKEPHKD